MIIRDDFKGKAIFTFPVLHHTLKADKMLKAAGISAAIIPTPPYLGSPCNFSLMLDSSLLSRVKDVLSDGVIIMKIYRL